MKKILITGANGFVGKNLSLLIGNQGFEVLKVVRATSKNEMCEMALLADYCFHLAGEVRPDAKADDFLRSNLDFTKDLLTALSQKPIDIVFTSTVHANTSINDYGRTKSDAEKLIYNYGKLNRVNTHVFRLPHLFGPYCKPNYNSVITTWIYNALNGLELQVFDRDYELTYIYIKDIINVFSMQIGHRHTLSLPSSYKIKLGELKSTILKLVDYSDYSDENAFLNKLCETVDFMREENYES
jgi:UDP-2-acetamido-2,6-beta-L-arabino-hexul-4-ose reductase